MDYTLAKALKDTGFFQEGRGPRVPPPDKIVVRRADYAYVPTLEELIEACNTTFTIYIEGHRADATKAGSEIKGSGDTPKQAVARLWLQLNSK
jgi:hypothetical protein